MSKNPSLEHSLFWYTIRKIISSDWMLITFSCDYRSVSFKSRFVPRHQQKFSCDWGMLTSLQTQFTDVRSGLWMLQSGISCLDSPDEEQTRTEQIWDFSLNKCSGKIKNIKQDDIDQIWDCGAVLYFRYWSSEKDVWGPTRMFSWKNNRNILLKLYCAII